jgi:hypothetical protein
LIKINGTFQVSVLNDTALNFTIFTINGIVNSTTSILGSNLGRSWHEMSASLFNFTWNFYLDGQLLLTIPDTMLYYNMTSQLGDSL